MWRAFWIFAALGAIFAGFLAWVNASATFLFVHPRASDVRIVIDRETGQAVVVGKSQEENATEKYPTAIALGQPKIQADELEYDFGIMDPLMEGTHAFVLKNVGAAPLKLTVGPTTCKCTVGGLDKREVAPGDRATVTLQWTTGESILYSHAASIYTNDPDRKSLDFRVSGKVRMQFGADVTELVIPAVRPNESAASECFVYTQVWDDFDVQSVDSQLAGLTWEMTKVEPGQAPQLAAKAVQRLRVVIPAAGLSPRFSDTLQIRAKVPGTEDLQSFELPVQGNVLGRYTVYGGDIVDGAVELGSVPWGRGKKTKVLIKIRDAQPGLGNAKVEITPSFLHARFEPREGGAPGLYDLHVELPAQTPVCQYLGTPQGEVTIATDHPRIGTLRFPLRFAVLERRD